MKMVRNVILSRTLSLILFVVAFSASAFAETKMDCFGAQDNKGARGTVIFSGKDMTFEGNELQYHRGFKDMECIAGFAADYKPRSNTARLAKFYVSPSESCNGYYEAWVSKDILRAGRGYIEFARDCGHDGDVCSAKYFCKVQAE